VPAGAPPDASQATVVHPISHGWTQVATPYVATPAVLAFYRIPAADLAPGIDILTSRPDLGRTELGTGFTGEFRADTVRVSSRLPKYGSAPNTLITPAAMAADRFTAEPSGWLVQTRKAITSGQITDARNRAAAAGFSIETRTASDETLQQLRDYSTLAGLLVALGVLAMTVGLIRSETAGDLRTLVATGASNATRRTLNAASAAALALLGGILGTATAYLALIAWHWHDVSYLDRPPYPNLAVLILGLPVVAAVGAWLLGRAPKALGRRPLE
jgi:putative ABC transport system permease protein